MKAATERSADICVLLNPGSGKRRGAALVAELETIFARHPGRFALRRLSKGTDIPAAARQAAAEGFATVAAAGGDGTISGVAGGLVGSGARLGVLTLGTFNYFARALGLPDTLEEAVGVLLDGRPQPIAIGTVNGHVFLNNASLGAYASILERREDVYRRWGRSRAAAFWSVLTTLAETRDPMVLRVTVDGTPRRLRTPLAFIASNAYQLDQFGLAGADCVRDGQFALFVAPDCGRAELLRFALRLAMRRMEPGRDFELFCGREILIESRRPQRLVARDGERSRMAAPFRFEVKRDALEVLVPGDGA